MLDTPPDEFKASDLPIALYLNQRVTFDLLAVLEDGFTRMATIQTSSSNAETTGLEAGAQLGIANPFAFLGLSLGGKGKRDTIAKLEDLKTEQLVHTPTSLFAKLRRELSQRALIKTVNEELANFGELSPGDFVEFEATLRRSPLLIVLNTFLDLGQLAEVFDTQSRPAGTGSERRRKGQGNQQAGGQQGNQIPLLVRQIQGVRDAVTAAGSEDLIAECGPHRFVLTAERPFFVDPTMNDVIDGTFRILGKITRVVPKDADEGISLLRKTPLGNFGGLVGKLETAFASLPEGGFTGQKVETEIRAPTLQVIPVGIYA